MLKAFLNSIKALIALLPLLCLLGFVRWVFGSFFITLLVPSVVVYLGWLILCLLFVIRFGYFNLLLFPILTRFIFRVMSVNFR